MAFGDKYYNRGAVTLCFMGDGAVRQGSFHETLNSGGADIKIQFEKGLRVTDEIDLEKTNLQNSLILSRYLRAVFRKSKQAMLGPDISHR